MIKYLGLLVAVLSIYPLIRSLLALYFKNFINIEDFFIDYLIFVYIPVILLFAISSFFLV